MIEECSSSPCWAGAYLQYFILLLLFMLDLLCFISWVHLALIFGFQEKILEGLIRLNNIRKFIAI